MMQDGASTAGVIGETEESRWPLGAILQLGLPLLTAGAFFVFRGDATDLNDPNLPFAFRLLKDVAFTAAVFLPFIVALLGRNASIPPAYGVFWLAPMVLGLAMLAVGNAKTGSEFFPLGQFRNIAVYYMASAAIVIQAAWKGQTELLFRLIRILLAFSVVLGIGFYLFASNILFYTIHGRMIGTVGNPNFLGFLCFLWLVIIHANAASRERFGVIGIIECGLAVVGLFGAASLAALMSYAVWFAVIIVLRLTGAIPPSRALDRLIVWEIFGLIAAVIASAAFVTKNSSAQILFRLQIAAGGQSETTSIRSADLLRTYDELLTVHGILVGQTQTSTIIQFDGTNQTFLFNFGLPIFLLWSLYVVSPVLAGISAWRRWRQRSERRDWMAMMLVPFVAVSFFVEFWIQYVPEMYPTCVIFGLVMYFLFLEATTDEPMLAAPLYVS